MTERPAGPLAEKRSQVPVSVALCVVAAFVPVTSLAVVPHDSPIPFVVAVILQAFALTWLVRIAWSWRRPPQSPRATDFVLVAVALVTGAIALVLVREIVQSFGIRGSALPRVRSGGADAVDYAYLSAW